MAHHWRVFCYSFFIETLEQKCARQELVIEAQRIEIEALKERNRLLEAKLDHLIRRLFGKQSESLDPAQLELLLGDAPGKIEASPSEDALGEDASNAVEPKRPAKQRGGHRSRIQGLEGLPVETQEIIPDLVAAEPEAYVRIGEEVTELLDITPTKFFKRRIVRVKFRRKDCRHLPPIVAPAPSTPLLGGLPAAGLLAHLLVGKYIDHLPLYRQSEIFRRYGVGIPRDLIVHWIHQSIELILPVAHQIRGETLTSTYLQVDETPVRYLVAGSGKSFQGYLWVANDPCGSLFYHWGVGRGAAQLHECLGPDFGGHIQCDGYGVYKTYAKQHNEIELIACLAHIRRNFVEVLAQGPNRQAAQILRLIAQLYRIEEELRESKASPAIRESQRAWRSAPIVRRIQKLMQCMARKHRPQSTMGKALVYGIKHWETFARYLADGRFEIDNNLVENAVRPVKLGMKNWLFFGSKDAGHHAAAIYTLVENCRRHNVPVETYLRELLSAMPGVTDPEVIATLTPASIAATRKRKIQAA